MALDAVLTGANLDTAGNVKVSLSNVPENVGSVRNFSENDPGTITLTPYLKSAETSSDYRLRVGMDTVMFTDTFNATVQNTSNWNYISSTLSASMPGTGTLNFSTVQGTTNAHGAIMKTFQYFPIIGTAPLACEFSVGQLTAPLSANEVFLFGFGNPTVAATAPTDGIWMQLTTAGLIGVVAYNGSLTQSGVLATLASLAISTLYKISIIVGETEIEFWENDVLLGDMAIPVSNGQPCIAASQPAFMQKFNTGAVSNNNTMRVGDVTISLMDIAANKPWSHQLATQGQSSYIGQNGHTQGKTSLWANNTAPTAVALTNTTAAFTGLGGIAAVLPTLTANNDGILFNFLNPAPTINITGRNLVITDVTVQGAVSVILAGGAVIYAYAVAFGHTNVALSTAETSSFATATTHAPRIVPLGFETYPVTAAAGTLGAGVQMQLSTPIVVRPGENIAITARNIGTVTTTGAITIIASFSGYWE